MAKASRQKIDEENNGSVSSEISGGTGKNSAAKRAAKAAALAGKREQAKDEIFALDIGTRNVVGIIGHNDADGKFCVDHAVSVPHTQRAMIDGQIEDIPEVARVSRIVKTKLEEKSGISLSRVAIAAAGRALKTHRIELSFDIEDKEAISEEDVRTYELETALKAQDELDTANADSRLSFYCVGHTVIQYLLDDYKIKSLVGHKGKKISIELIAAFLPSSVVESLYAVMDMNGLEVASLTLEPIAAMNIIIPPEVRLINVALVDIGAGTSDIAISQNGSIVAYAMSTTAGDEITEEIIKKYIVDFNTAEEMKLSSDKAKIVYNDILGFEHTVESSDFFKALYPVVEVLASNIAENIIAANGQAPAAVFLVGGGSLIPGLAKFVSEKLEIPENRVAVGSKNVMKNVYFGNNNITGPEYVTPIGIGVTATHSSGYDFSVVTLNDKKMRMFDTRTMRVLDLLMTAGYKSSQVIGRSGRNLSYTINGEKQLIKGKLATAAEVTLNGAPASIETSVKQGDVVIFKPAESGSNAEAKLSDVVGNVADEFVTVDGTKYQFGILAKVNNKPASGEYQIQNLDNITVSEIETLGDLMQALPFDTSLLEFYKAGKLLSIDYYLKDGDNIVTSNKPKDKKPEAGDLAKSFATPEKEPYQGGLLLGVDGTPLAPAEAPAVPEAATESAPTITATSAAPEAAAVQTAAPEPAPAPVEIPAPAPVEAPAPAAPASSPAPSPAPSAEPPIPSEFVPDNFYVMLNGERTDLDPNPNNRPHEFIELMALANIDTDNPPPSGNMILTINGKNASFMDVIRMGDEIVIRWADK
ncbi:MAG: pilus assembly protein PilM [Oscillospiraceae bacterium]|nr:pilus assembly protein PilM [Oscillospiraceae bacterium]